MAGNHTCCSKSLCRSRPFPRRMPSPPCQHMASGQTAHVCMCCQSLWRYCVRVHRRTAGNCHDGAAHGVNRESMSSPRCHYELSHNDSTATALNGRGVDSEARPHASCLKRCGGRSEHVFALFATPPPSRKYLPIHVLLSLFCQQSLLHHCVCCNSCCSSNNNW